MKRTLYLMTLIILLGSCKSIEKHVEQGNYDEAIYLAAKKLQGKKNKKTKHIKALEKAFAKVNSSDIAFLDALYSEQHPERWDRAYDILQQIKRRQDKINAFLPLVSKDGYRAHFDFLEVYPLIQEASQLAADYHYEKAQQLLGDIDYSQKENAITAFESLKKIERYFQDYKDRSILEEKAHHYGKTRILLQNQNSSNAYIPEKLQDAILAINLPAAQSFWTTFYRNPPGDIPMDYKVLLDIETVDLSPVIESESVYIDTRDIRDGFSYILDQNGNVAKDSLGNDLKEDRFITIAADVIERTREKAAYIRASLQITDLHRMELLDQFPIATEAISNQTIYQYYGDERALSSRSRNRLRSQTSRLPSDEELIWQAAEDIKSVMIDYMYEIVYL